MSQTINRHNSNNKKYFENAVKNGMLAHAYLFSGPEGAGKKDFAFELFRMLNGREPGGDPDFQLLSPRVEEDETKIYIDDIRNIRSCLALKPYYGLYKFVVVNEADRLEAEASNAFLKMLEDPSPMTVIILISSKPKQILPTVVSRCEKVQFVRSEELELDKETIKAINEFVKAAKLGIPGRLKYAEKLYKEGDYQKLFAGLIHWLHKREKKNVRVMKALLELNHLVSQPQYNHRLAIENFLINL